mmetsp:Transcript_9889/g.13587  ORF Transcript_9889/g.13587 Transcript_9889/m.13587 type:complete len:295 (-) Transcript_9889:651-1535(-)
MTRMGDLVLVRLGNSEVCNNLSSTASNLLAHIQVKELIRTMSIGARAKYTGDDKAGLREPLSKHGHEWNGTSFTHVDRRFVEELLRCTVHRLLQPVRQDGGLPAVAWAIRRIGEANVSSIRWVLLQQLLDSLGCFHTVHVRRHTNRQLQGDFRVEHITCLGGVRKARSTNHSELRSPCLIQQQLSQIISGWLASLNEGESLVGVLTQELSSLVCLLDSLLGNVHIEVLQQDLASLSIFQSVQQHTNDTVCRGNDTTAIPRVDTLGSNLDSQHTFSNSSQRGGHPELFIVSTARI